MRQKRSSIAVSGAIGFLLVLTACSSPNATSSEEEPPSPLAEYLNAVWGGDLSEEEQQARFEKEDRQREELTAECMAEEGFDYVPNVQTGSLSFGSADDWRPDDRDWVEKYGYGMVDSPGSDVPPDEEYVDPNADYVNSLSENEQEAFYEALYGPPVPEDQTNDDGSYEWDWETAGCYGWAQNEMSQEDPTQSDEFAPLMEAMDEFWTGLPTRPEFVELDAEWSTCMDEAGFPGFAAQTDAQESIIEEQNAYWESNPEAPGMDDADMKALQEKEIELALADLDCREEVDYRDRYRTVQFAAEEEFIDDHKADLDALKAAAAQRAS